MLDFWKNLIYLETDAPPWQGNPSPFMNIWTREQARGLAAGLERDLPAYVLLRRGGPSREIVVDTWASVREIVERRCQAVETVWIYDLWRCSPGLS